MRSISSPQAMIDLRAQIEKCKPGFCKVLGAFNIKGWKNGKKKLSNREIAAYSGLEIDNVKDLTSEMVDYGWLSRSRTKGNKEYVYEKTIEEMTWDEAHEIARLRLSGDPQQKELFGSVPRETISKAGGKRPLSWGEKTPELGAKDPCPNSIKGIFKDSLKGSGLKPAAYQTRDGHPFKALTDAWLETYLEFRKGSGLEAIVKADAARHIKKGVRALSKLGQEEGFLFEEFLRRLKNLPKHQFARKQDCSLTFFLSHYSEFADGAQALSGGPGARYFVAAPEKRKPGED